MKIKNTHKCLFITLIITLICCFNLSSVNAQFFDSDQNPPSVKWQQINTTNFQIIYPIEFESEAQRMANTLQNIIGKVSKTLHKEPRKISIILQNQGVISNGFVQLAPRRSEFFTTSPQEFDYQDWLNSLAVHELRHVVQFDKLTGNLKAPFFEELGLAIFGVTLPPWFYEGDAVGIETALTNAGRGRLPSWELPFRTNVLSGQSYSYSKDYLGSLRNVTPGYYQLGYFMTTKLKRDYGEGIMDKVFSNISKNYIRPYNLSRSIKKYIGLNTRQLHDSTVAELRRLWQKQSAEAKTVDYATLNKRTNTIPTDYLLPVARSSTEILALKEGKAQTPQLVSINPQGDEKLIIRIGYQDNPNFSYANNKLVWDELRYDVRFQKRSFNVINSYDLISKTYRQLTHKSRLFSPSLSPDGKTIAAIKISLANTINLVELDTESGKELRVYENPDNLQLQTPAYNSKGDKIVFTASGKQGSTICEINKADGRFKQLIPFQQQQVSKPAYLFDQIIFRAHFNGIDNIYALNPETQQITPLTSAKYGAYNPTIDAVNKKLLFNNYQLNGYDIVSIPIPNNNADTLTGKQKNTFINYAQPLVAQESNGNVFDSISTVKFTSKPYKEFSHLFYFHSLSPILEENDFNDDLNMGLKIRSNNKLNTLDFYAGYQYNNGLNRSEYLTGFTYKRFFPVLDVKYINRARLATARQVTADGISLIPVNWRENLTKFEISVPLAFNQLNMNYNLGFTASTSYTSRYDIQNRPLNFYSTLKFPLLYEVYFSRNTARSARDLAPRWGQSFALSYQNLPFETQLKGDLFSLRTSFFIPGLLQNHSTQIRFNYQKNSGVYGFDIDIPRVSGYANLKPPKELKNTLLLNYRFPLLYPDLEIGPLAYIKRIRGGFFADFENVGKENPFSPRTYGLSLYADMNLLRFYLPNFEIGGKLIFVNEKPTQNPIFEFGFNYNY